MGYVYSAMYFWGGVFLVLWTICVAGALVGRLVLNTVFHKPKGPRISVNVITAAGLCPLLAYVVLALTLDLFSGVLQMDDSDITVLLAILGLLGIWSCLAFVWQLISLPDERHPSTRADVLWAGIQFGVVVLMVVGLFAFEGTCVSETNGSAGTCGLPMRPGVAVPTPVPGS